VARGDTGYTGSLGKFISSDIDCGTPYDVSNTRVQLRRGTSLQWTTLPSPYSVLRSGEIGIETDTGAIKAGNGTASWNTLPYTNNAQNSLATPSSTRPPTVDAVNAALAVLATPGLLYMDSNNDITEIRTLGASDFDGYIRRINSEYPITVTVPTVADMGLESDPNILRTIVFLHMALGDLEFYASEGVTINGVAGPSIVNPVGGGAVGYKFYTLTQMSVNGDEWALS